MATEKAQSVLEEIKSTEQTYLAGLKHLLSNKANMLAAYHKTKPAQLDGKISQAELTSFFKAIEDLIKDSERLLAQINDSPKNYEAMAKAIESSAKHFADASAYRSLIIQKKLPDNVKEAFKGEVNISRKSVNDFAFYAIMPTQRGPRYEMLFKDLQKNQSEDTEKKRIEVTINAAKKIGNETEYRLLLSLLENNKALLAQEKREIQKYKKNSVESFFSQEIYQQLLSQDKSGKGLNKQEAILKAYIKESNRYDMTIKKAALPKDQQKAEQLKRDFTNQYIKFIEKNDPKNVNSLRNEIQKMAQNKPQPPIVFNQDKSKVSSSQKPDEARAPSSTPQPKEKRKL